MGNISILMCRIIWLKSYPKKKNLRKKAITRDIDRKKTNQLVTGIGLNIAIDNEDIYLGKPHTQLRDTELEMDLMFIEFCIFSETHFMEYAHRTYNHFYSMYPILITDTKGCYFRWNPSRLGTRKGAHSRTISTGNLYPWEKSVICWPNFPKIVKNLMFRLLMG